MRAACLAVWALLAATSPVTAQPAQIVISQPAEATTMDPGRSTQVLTVNYFVNLYDTLTRWDTGLQLQPGLATSWKTINDITWVFQEVVVYGVSRRVSFKPRADYRLIVSEMSLAR